MSAPILVITEQFAGDAPRLHAATGEAMAAAQQLAARAQTEVVAAVLEGEGSDLAPQVAAWRLARVYRLRHAALAAYSPDTWVRSLVQLITQVKPMLVLLPHTYQVRDYAPRLATRMGAGLITDVTGFAADGPPWHFLRPVFQGKWLAETEFVGDGPGFVTLQIGAFRADHAARADTPAPIEDVAVTPGESMLHAEPVFREARQTVDLSQAERIVAVGRGIREAAHLDMARELASALDAELAASRPICDNGWLPMDRQVGSSGQTVAPRLYLALGISGAIQHLVGMKGARTIVAINKDASAPIFEIADYGLVGDLFQIVPALITQLRQAPERK